MPKPLSDIIIKLKIRGESPYAHGYCYCPVCKQWFSKNDSTLPKDNLGRLYCPNKHYKQMKGTSRLLRCRPHQTKRKWSNDRFISK